VLPQVAQTCKLRPDAYSRAIAGASSGAICAFNVAWYHTSQFSRVLSHIGSYVALQWRPEQKSGWRLHRFQQGEARTEEEYPGGYRTRRRQ
jgi:enterochelin esterase-like enzyme